jgi:hypothetical protein
VTLGADIALRGIFLTRRRLCDFLGEPFSPVPFLKDAEKARHVLNDLARILSGELPLRTRLPNSDGFVQEITAEPIDRATSAIGKRAPRRRARFAFAEPFAFACRFHARKT